MMNSPELIWADDKLGNTQRVLSIYGEIAFNKKLQNEAVMQKMKENLVALNSDQYFASNIAAIWSGILDKHKESLNALMKTT